MAIIKIEYQYHNGMVFRYVNHSGVALFTFLEQNIGKITV